MTPKSAYFAKCASKYILKNPYLCFKKMNHVVRVCTRTSLFNVKITKVGYLSENWFVSTLHYTAEYAKIDDFFSDMAGKSLF